MVNFQVVVLAAVVLVGIFCELCGVHCKSLGFGKGVHIFTDAKVHLRINLYLIHRLRY